MLLGFLFPQDFFNVKFKTVLSEKDIIEKIKSSSDQHHWHTLLTNAFVSDNHISHKIKNDEITLYHARMIYRHPFKTRFNGRILERKKESTLIIGDFHVSLFARLFFILWESLALSVPIILVVLAILKIGEFNSNPSELFFGLITVMAFPIFGGMIFYLSRYMAIKEKNEIEEFLLQKCLASRVS